MKFFLFQSYSAAFCSVLWIKNNLFWIRRWLFGVLDPDFTHMLFTVSLFRNYWKKLAFIINQNEEFTNHRYLPFSISNYSPTVQQSRIRRPEIINNYKILIYLLFHSCPIRSGTSNSRSGTLVSLYARFFLLFISRVEDFNLYRWRSCWSTWGGPTWTCRMWTCRQPYTWPWRGSTPALSGRGNIVRNQILMLTSVSGIRIQKGKIEEKNRENVRKLIDNNCNIIKFLKVNLDLLFLLWAIFFVFFNNR